MDLLESDIIKINILKVLNNTQTDLTMNGLRKKVGSINYQTLIRNCKFLELLGLIVIESKIIDDRNIHMVKITENGKKFISNVK